MTHTRSLTLFGRLLPAIAGALVLAAGQPASATSVTASGSANGGLKASAAIDFMISVPRVMQMRLLQHPAAIDVTADDIARGAVTISGPQIELLVNDRFGYLLRAEILNAMFSGLRIVGLPAAVVAGGAQSVTQMPTMVGRPKPAPMPVTYELSLAPGAVPGHYAWPVALSLQQP